MAQHPIGDAGHFLPTVALLLLAFLGGLRYVIIVPRERRVGVGVVDSVDDFGQIGQFLLLFRRQRFLFIVSIFPVDVLNYE